MGGMEQEQYTRGVSMNDVDEDMYYGDEQMDEPMDMDQDEQPEGMDMEAGEGDMDADAADDADVDPALAYTNLSKEQKLAFTQGLNDWDSKINDLFEKKNQDLEAQLPAGKKK